MRTSAVAGIAVAGLAIAGTEELRGSGGAIFHVGRRRTKEDLRAVRERFGIPPEIVEKALAKPKALESGSQLDTVAYTAAYRAALLRTQQQLDEEALALVLLLH